MKTVISKFISLGLFIAIFITSPQFLLAQSDRPAGELTIVKNTSANGEGFVTVNGERVLSGRSVMSPSDIATSPEVTAKVSIPQTGTILISPNSKLNLSFINSNIGGDFLAGEVIIETVPNTAINLLTIDGTITVQNQNQTNVVKISIENGRTRVNPLTGQVIFNNVVVSAGETYPSPVSETATAKKSGISPILIIGVLGAVAVVALVALSSSSGSNSGNTPIVSPVS